MARLSLEDFDKHIDNLRAQLHFLSEILDATDHNAPDWLATDLISVRNKSGRLHDDMKRFRDQLETEGLAEKQIKTSNKRLSLENSKPAVSTPEKHATSSQNQAVSPPLEQSPTPKAKPTHVEDTYVVQHIDVTEEVHRRLRETRLRRLMETPRTAHKRKYNAYDEETSESAVETEDGDWKDENSCSEYERTPTKRIKYNGTFEQTGKRKEDGNSWAEEDEGLGNRTELKKRKLEQGS